MTYKTKARLLSLCGFWIYGEGNFDITTEELAQILKWIEEEDFKSIKKFYKKLKEERL